MCTHGFCFVQLLLAAKKRSSRSSYSISWCGVMKFNTPSLADHVVSFCSRIESSFSLCSGLKRSLLRWRKLASYFILSVSRSNEKGVKSCKSSSIPVFTLMPLKTCVGRFPTAYLCSSLVSEGYLSLWTYTWTPSLAETYSSRSKASISLVS